MKKIGKSKIIFVKYSNFVVKSIENIYIYIYSEINVSRFQNS